jgi:hypothetical protein
MEMFLWKINFIKTLSLMKTARMLSVTLLMLIIAAISPIVSSCNGLPQNSKGDGSTVTETRAIGEFTGIQAGGAFTIIITQGDSYGLTVEADKDLIQYIETKVVGSTLKINMKNTFNHWPHDGGKMIINVTCKTLKNLDFSGAVDVKTTNQLNVPELGIDVSGAVEADLNMAVQKVDMVLSGACELTLKGTATTMSLDASGASEVDAFGLVCTDVTVFGSGAIEAKVNATGSLKANASGACDIRYKGTPRVDVSTSGASSIKRAD